MADLAFRCLHVLQPEDDFCTGRRRLLRGIVPVAEPTGIGWPFRGAKSVGIIIVLGAQCQYIWRKSEVIVSAWITTDRYGQGEMRGGVGTCTVEVPGAI